MSEILKFAEGHTLSNEECFDRYTGLLEQRHLYESNLCAVYRPGVGAYYGDSGIVFKNMYIF